MSRSNSKIDLICAPATFSAEDDIELSDIIPAYYGGHSLPDLYRASYNRGSFIIWQWIRGRWYHVAHWQAELILLSKPPIQLDIDTCRGWSVTLGPGVLNKLREVHRGTADQGA